MATRDDQVFIEVKSTRDLLGPGTCPQPFLLSIRELHFALRHGPRLQACFPATHALVIHLLCPPLPSFVLILCLNLVSANGCRSPASAGGCGGRPVSHIAHTLAETGRAAICASCALVPASAASVASAAATRALLHACPYSPLKRVDLTPCLWRLDTTHLLPPLLAVGLSLCHSSRSCSRACGPCAACIEARRQGIKYFRRGQPAKSVLTYGVGLC